MLMYHQNTIRFQGTTKYLPVTIIVSEYLCTGYRTQDQNDNRLVD